MVHLFEHARVGSWHKAWRATMHYLDTGTLSALERHVHTALLSNNLT
jgi:hypothetical protein